MFDWTHSVKLKLAANTIAGGGVIAYPTEGVWGLGCDPYNRNATESILTLKQRAVDKGLILVAASYEQFQFLLRDITGEQQQVLKNSWPGPNTWLVPHNYRVPQWICGKHNSVAIRVSDHPLVRALCHHYGGPIVSTSANPQGLPPATTALKVRLYFGSNPLLDLITPGRVGQRKTASIIRDLMTMQVLRA